MGTKINGDRQRLMGTGAIISHPVRMRFCDGSYPGRIGSTEAHAFGAGIIASVPIFSVDIGPIPFSGFFASLHRTEAIGRMWAMDLLLSLLVDFVWALVEISFVVDVADGLFHRSPGPRRVAIAGLKELQTRRRQLRGLCVQCGY